MRNMNWSSANTKNLQSNCLREIHKCTCGRMTVFPEIASIPVLIHGIIFSISVVVFKTSRTEESARKVIWAHSWYYKKCLWYQLQILLSTDISVQCLRPFKNVLLMKKIQRRAVRNFRSLESITFKENLKDFVLRLKIRWKKTGYFFSGEWQMKSLPMVAVYWTRIGLKFWKKRVVKKTIKAVRILKHWKNLSRRAEELPSSAGL